MKRVFILLCSVVVIMAGCVEATDPINESGEVTATPSYTTTATTTATAATEPPATAEAEQETEKETYEYKGITFEGIYYDMGRYESFFIDKDFLYEGGGLNLYEASYNAVIAFLNGDIEYLLLHFTDDDEKINKLLKELVDMKKYPSRSGEINSFCIMNADPFIVNGKVDSIGIFCSYNLKGQETSHDIGIDMYLDDEGEWKIKFIGYAK